MLTTPGRARTVALAILGINAGSAGAPDARAVLFPALYVPKKVVAYLHDAVLHALELFG